MVLLLIPAMAGAQFTVNIHRVQSFLPNSPMLGLTVTTEGIVTVVLKDGFYIENSYETHWCLDPTILNCWDNDVSTAEGIFVQTASKPDPSYATVGNLVMVTGKVVYSNSSADPSAVGVELKASSTPTRVDNATHALPPTIDARVFASARTGLFGQWLEFSGMQVEISFLTTSSPTGGAMPTGVQPATSNGQFWGVLTDSSGATSRPFRAPGISVLEPVPGGAPVNVARWSGNPSLLLVDSTTRGGPALDVAANQTISNLVGIVDYHQSALGYTALLLDPVNGHGAISPGPAPSGTPAATPTDVQATVATLDLDSFYDETTLNAMGFAGRVAKTSLAIVHFLNSPDILAVQQVQSASALTSLATQIAADGGPTYSPCWIPGNDPSGLTNGFLVNESRVNVTSCTQVDADKTFQAANGMAEKLFDRPPLVLAAGLRRSFIADYPITVINSEFLDRTNIDDPTLGARVRAKRATQAEELSAIVQKYQSDHNRVVALGEFHSYEFSDGFVDTMGAVAGTPAPADEVVLQAATVTKPALVNLTTTSNTNPSDRYTGVENGSAEQTDHILVTADLAAIASLSYARLGADFPVADLNDTTTALHASGHDGVVAYLAIPQGAQFTLSGTPNPSYFGENVTFTATLNGGVGIPTGTVSFYEGNTALCNSAAMSGGVATCETTTLSIGQHDIKAVYSGDGVYDPQTASMTQTVKPDPVFSLSISPGGNSVYTGEAASYLVSITPGEGFKLNVALSCTGLPPSTTCSFAPATVQGGGTGVANLDVHTSAPVNRAASTTESAGRSLALLAAVLLAIFPRSFRRRSRWLVVLLFAFMSAVISACGSSGTLVGGTPPATYTITVRGDAIGSPAPVSETASTTLKVNSLF